MATRTVFLRSPLGSRVRSPLGMFKCFASQFLEILTVPIFMMDGETYAVTGELFLTTQGTGMLQIANTPDFDDVVVTQTITTWADDEIVFDYDGTGLPTDGILWIKVTNDNGQYDVAISQSVVLDCPLLFENRVWSFGTYNPLNIYNGRYCTGVFDYSVLNEVGYLEFFETSPGFRLVGSISGKVVALTTPALIESTEGPTISWLSWGSAEGILSVTVPASDPGNAIAYILYDVVEISEPCTDLHGWNEDDIVYLVPDHPVSIQITSPLPEVTLPAGNEISLVAISFAEEGNISDEVEWYDGPALSGTYLGTGSSLPFEVVEGTITISAKITNQSGQIRYSEVEFYGATLSIYDIFPYIGSEDGGARITIYGEAFTASTTVQIGGNPATGVTFFNEFLIQCIAPPGTGIVDVAVFDGLQEYTEPSFFEYAEITDIHISGISPTTGSVSGGTSITITGTGFTSDCEVYLGFYDGIYELASSIDVVSDTEITCNTPAWIEDPGSVDLIVIDIVSGPGDIKISAFTYT